MPWIIDYQTVLERLQGEGLRCNYHNSGAFGYAMGTGVGYRGWIGPEDSTIKPGLLALVRKIAPPYEEHLSEMLVEAWRRYLPGNVWVMPASHWSYELNFGSRDWMPALLERLEVDPGLLMTRNNAAAIEFAPTEQALLATFSTNLLQMLQASDFVIAFPARNAVCTLHHHKQLWWSTTSVQLLAQLDSLGAEWTASA